MAIIYPQVMYDNFLRRVTPTLSFGTEYAGFESPNAYDWRDFSLWRCRSILTLKVDLGSAMAVDTLVMWPSTTLPTNNILLQYSDDNSAFTTAVTMVPGDFAANVIKWYDVAHSTPHRYWQIATVGLVGANDSYWRQVAFGQKLTMLRGQWQGVAPTKFIGGNVFSNMIAENGSILGRNVRRTEKKGELSLSHLTDTWIRASWEPFAQHATRYPFFYRWNPTGKPDDVAFAAATEIEPATNDSPPPFLRVSMPMRLITD